MSLAVGRIVVLAVLVSGGPTSAQTPTEMLEHIDDLGKKNEKMQERVRTLEQENAALRDRLRQFGVTVPPAGSANSQPIPLVANPKPGEPGPALPIPPPSPGGGPVSFSGTIDLDSDPAGAQAATSLGSGCETPCAMEISADGPFTVTFTRPGYAPATVNIGMQPGLGGTSGPKFSPNPVFVQLVPQSKKKSAAPGPQKLGPAR